MKEVTRVLPSHAAMRGPAEDDESLGRGRAPLEPGPPLRGRRCGVRRAGCGWFGTPPHPTNIRNAAAAAGPRTRTKRTWRRRWRYLRGGDPGQRVIRAGVGGEGDGSRPGVVGSLCEPTRWAMHGSCCRRLRVWEGYNRNPQASRGMLRRAGGAPARRTRRPGSTCIQARTLPWLTPRSRRAKVAPRWFRRSTY